MMINKTWGEGQKPDPLQTSLLNLYLGLPWSILCSLFAPAILNELFPLAV